MGKFKDLTGHKFGKLIVLYRSEDYISPKTRKPRAVWHCRCLCGNETDVLGENLRKGNTTSCGCAKSEIGEIFRTHGQTNSRLYLVWQGMKSRCYNPNNPQYKNYGGGGIFVCCEWRNSYVNFMRWAINNGYDKRASRGVCTIDRIDNNQGYYPENCRIVAQQVQMNNVRYNRILSYGDESHTISEWSKIVEKSSGAIRNRIDKYGYTVEDALFKPLRNNSKKIKNKTTNKQNSKIYDYGKFNGTEMISLRQAHKPGTNEFVLNDSQVFIVAGDDKPVKVVNEGEGLMIDRDPTENNDLTQEYFYGQAVGVGVICANKMAVYTFSS